MGKMVHWTETEVNFLKDNFSKMTVKEIAKKLKRPYGGVRWKATELGLSKLGKSSPMVDLREPMHTQYQVGRDEYINSNTKIPWYKRWFSKQ